MKRLRAFLGIMLACCGIIQINLIKISSNAGDIDLFIGSLILIGVFLGILRYKIMDNALEYITKLTVYIGILLIVNIIYIGIVVQFPISVMNEILTIGSILTLMTFEESTWFLFLNIEQ